jgi:general secretion pathway protein M
VSAVPASVRRLIAILILLALLAGVGFVASLPFSILARQDAELAQLGRQSDELDHRLGLREGLLDEQRLLERASEADQTLIQAETPALAAAELQRELSALVAQGGGMLESVQSLGPVDTPPFVKIPIRVSFTGSLEGLRTFLYAVEQHAPVLLVEELSVAETIIYREEDGAELPALSTVIELFGYARAKPAV